MKQKLTKRAVEALQPGDKDVICWDSQLPGFGLKVTTKGRRVYFLYYRTASGRERRPTIGHHGVIPCERARKIAADWLLEVRNGGDPGGERLTERKSQSFAEFAERYMTDYAVGRKKPSTIATDRTNLKHHLLPALGRLKVGEISRADVVRLHQSMQAKPGAANRSLELLSHMMTVAEMWRLRPDNSNPCRRVKKYRLKKHERFLSEAELGRLAGVLNEVERARTEMPSVIATIRLLLFTGARLGEIRTLRWDYVDMGGQCLRLPDSKTGPKTIYLPPAALEVLSELERYDDNPFVIVGAKPGTCLVNIQRPWRRIRKQAGLDDVRIHDLRHSFASMAVAGGLSLPMIGALLGHTQPSTTARYAHLADDPKKQAADLIGGWMAAAMDGGNQTEDELKAVS